MSVPIIFPVYNLNFDKKDLTRTRGENVNNKVWVSVPIIFEKKSPRPRDNKQTFKKNENKRNVWGAVPILGDEKVVPARKFLS